MRLGREYKTHLNNLIPTQNPFRIPHLLQPHQLLRNRFFEITLNGRTFCLREEGTLDAKLRVGEGTSEVNAFDREDVERGGDGGEN